MNLFELIIAPFIFIIKETFLFCYELSDSYGVAIILLSFAISLLLLPIFILIEKVKKKDDLVKLKMKPLVDEIKRCYKGQERYYYIKTLNRQHNFSPIRSLIPILSLLLQIPFFIAAYQFLENFEPLEGVGFLFINDLSAPDALFGVVNFLPIAMTMVNLLTAYFYTRNGDTSERKQMLGVAAVFLVLLFNLPSCLVLYWTMNNVFSFLRLFVTNREVFRKSESSASINSIKLTELKLRLKLLVPKLKITFWVLVLLSIALQINWAFDNNFDTIYVRLLGAVAGSFILIVFTATVLLIYDQNKLLLSKINIKNNVYFALLFFTAYFFLAAKYYFTGINNTINIFASIVLIPTQFIGLLNFVRVRKQLNQALFQSVAFLLIISFIFQIFILYNCISGNEIVLDILNIKILVKNSTFSNFISSGIILITIVTPFYIKNIESKFLASTHKSHLILYIISAFYITGFIFLWNPLIVYSSSPESFNFSASSILKMNLNLFAISFGICIALYLLLKQKAKKILLTFILFVAVIGFIYSSIIPINMGTLQMHRFSNAGNLAVHYALYIVEAFFLLGIFIGISKMLVQNYYKQLIAVLIILNLIPITQSIVFSIMPEKCANTIKTSQEQNTTSIALNTPNTISFSKNSENIVFIMVDMFQGWYLRTILEDDPDLKNSFDGFVWYPNTLSVSNYTASSMPALLSGYEYTPDKLDMDTVHTLAEKMVFSNEAFRDKAKDKGFNFTSTDVPYSSMDKNTIDAFIPLWHNDWDYLKNTLNIGNSRELSYKVLWQNAAFFCAPLFIKAKIYNNGAWMGKNQKSNENSEVSKHHNFLRALPYISNTNAKKSNLILICSKASHFPWDIVDDNGILINDVTPYENNKWTISKIAEWMDWMKQNDVYDNTKIIIVSDHGIRDTEINDTIMIENPFIPKISEKISLLELLNYTPLLMVKDFNSKGLIREDWRFMSNADAALITFDENDPTKIEPPLKRSLNAFYISWRIKVYENKKYPIDKFYKVSENVYELKNWTLIDK